MPSAQPATVLYLCSVVNLLTLARTLLRCAASTSRPRRPPPWLMESGPRTTTTTPRSAAMRHRIAMALSSPEVRGRDVWGRDV